jgi:hypothetical protein
MNSFQKILGSILQVFFGFFHFSIAMTASRNIGIRVSNKHTADAEAPVDYHSEDGTDYAKP